MINFDLPNVHFLPYMDVKGVSFFTPSQLISLDLMIVHIWHIKGMCHALILSKATKKSLTHGNSWKFSSMLPAKVGGEGILFLWFGVLLVSI